MKNWKGVLASVAPALASALGGPLAGVAVKTIGDRLLGKPDATEDDVAAALAGGDASVLVRLREIDAQFRKEMAQIGVDLEKIAAEDRASARAREVSARDSWTPRVLAAVVVVGFFATVYMVLAGHVAGLKDPRVAVLVGTLVGYASAKADQVVGYYFGSSVGSARKTELMGQSSG